MQHGSKNKMCDDKCQWIFLTIIILKNLFFFLDAVGVVWLCCPRICSGSDWAGARPVAEGNWQLGTSTPWCSSPFPQQVPGSPAHAGSCLPPSLLSCLQSGLLWLPDVTLPVWKEQRMELGLQSCKVAFQGKLERRATTDRS